MKKITIVVAISAGFLTGCAAAVNTSQHWIKFHDKKGAPAKEMRFMEQVSLSKSTLYSSVGSFVIRENGVNQRSIDIFESDSKDKSFSLVNLDTGMAATTLNQDTFKQIGMAKAFRFYDLGRGMVEVADYSSKNGVCPDFFSAKGVEVEFASNYYINSGVESDNFSTIFGKAKLTAKEGATVISKSMLNNFKGSQANQVAARLKKELDLTTQADARKLGRFLFMLCANVDKKYKF